MQELWIYDVIGEGFFESGVTDKTFRDDLKQYKNTDDITVRINSPGGSVSHAVAIKTLLDQHRGRVDVQIDGVAASAASYIAMAGESISIADGALMMIHSPWTTLAGDSAELRKAAETLDGLGQSMAKTYAARSGLPLDEVAELMDAETWYTADEAVQAGFADHLIAEHQAAAFSIPAAMGFKNTPCEPAEPHTRATGSRAILRRKLQLARFS